VSHETNQVLDGGWAYRVRGLARVLQHRRGVKGTSQPYADRTQAGGNGGHRWKRWTQGGASLREHLETAPLLDVLSLRRSRVRAPSAPPSSPITPSVSVRPPSVPRGNRDAGVYLVRYREISLQSNSRYLNALADVDDPSTAFKALDNIATRTRASTARPVKAFNPLARSETQVFAAVMTGEHALHGFSNRDLRDKLLFAGLCLADDPRKCSAQVTRVLHRLHVYALVAKIPRSRRWRVTRLGYRVMNAALHIRTEDFPRFHAVAA